MNLQLAITVSQNEIEPRPISCRTAYNPTDELIKLSFDIRIFTRRKERGRTAVTPHPDHSGTAVELPFRAPPCLNGPTWEEGENERGAEPHETRNTCKHEKNWPQLNKCR